MSDKATPRPSRRDLLRLVSQLSKAEAELQQQEIIAPLLPGGRIRTRIAGLVYEFKPRGNFVGWGRFRPLNAREVEALGEALPWERAAYLELFPALRMILLWPDPAAASAGAWLALAFNESDARQRFGFGGEPLPVFLCDPFNGAEQFERIIARVDGRTLWFDGPDVRADPTHAARLREAAARGHDRLEHTEISGLSASERHALLLWELHQVAERFLRERSASAESQSGPASHGPRQRPPQSRSEEVSQRAYIDRLAEQLRRAELAERLRHALAKADATLHSFHEVLDSTGKPAEIIVEWSQRGQRHRHRSTIDPGLTVVSSGICLSGRDRDFDLTSLVSVIAASPWSQEDEE
jgi:hypothetical protein